MDKFNYKINENTFELKPDTNIQIKTDEPFMVSVTFPHNPKILQRRKVIFTIQKPIKTEYWITSDYGKICIKTENPQDWRKFLSSNLLQLIGLIFATLIAEEKEDFLWIEKSNSRKVWILSLIWNRNYWEGMLVERLRLRPSDLNNTFWFNGENKEQYANELFNFLKDKEKGIGLPPDFPFFSDGLISDQQKHTKQLTIKVHPSELWFLLFPIDYFCRFENYGQFLLYKEVEWMLTLKKSFIQNICQRLVMQNELKNAENFLKHGVIILNIYPKEPSWGKNKRKWQKGTALVKRLMSLCQNVKINDKILSLRWYLNPVKDEIFSELLNNDTKYLFADFHTNQGKWQIGTGGRKTWENLSKAPQKTKDDSLELTFKQGDLVHIRLARIFQCHSVITLDSTRVYPRSINFSLLNAGVWRVEGSIIEESYMDYLCSLLYLFCNPQGLQPILIGKCLEEDVDFMGIMKDVNVFLKSCNYISQSNQWEAVI